MSIIEQLTPLLWTIVRCLATILVFLKTDPQQVEKSAVDESVLFLGDRLEALVSAGQDCQARFPPLPIIEQPPSLDPALIAIRGVG